MKVKISGLMETAIQIHIKLIRILKEILALVESIALIIMALLVEQATVPILKVGVNSKLLELVHFVFMRQKMAQTGHRKVKHLRYSIHAHQVESGEN